MVNYLTCAIRRGPKYRFVASARHSPSSRRLGRKLPIRKPPLVNRNSSMSLTIGSGPMIDMPAAKLSFIRVGCASVTVRRFSSCNFLSDLAGCVSQWGALGSHKEFQCGTKRRSPTYRELRARVATGRPRDEGTEATGTAL